ncbi:MAG: type II toxin-antitoxin system HicA family toxin [Candidatus Paceibacterota bacterium]|jgi:predicted RNA binding protein YcfA (HicA-like mRNA interferase family)
MPKRFFNWTFKDVENFLKENGFKLNYTNASHFYYIGNQKGILRNVCIPFHAQKSIKPRTLKGIILQSGIEQKEWFKD